MASHFVNHASSRQFFGYIHKKEDTTTHLNERNVNLRKCIGAPVRMCVCVCVYGYVCANACIY